jgi:hypothetical protein
MLPPDFQRILPIMVAAPLTAMAGFFGAVADSLKAHAPSRVDPQATVPELRARLARLLRERDAKHY